MLAYALVFGNLYFTRMNISGSKRNKKNNKLNNLTMNMNSQHVQQRFSNFFVHGPLFSSGIVGGPPHFRVATFALLQSGTGVRQSSHAQHY